MGVDWDTFPPLQGHHHGRSRGRTVHVTPSSATGLTSSYNHSHSHPHTHAHINGHVHEPSSKNSSPGSSVYEPKRRPQPIGADANPLLTEAMRMNGMVKRTSLVMDGMSLKGSQTAVTMSMRRSSHDSTGSVRKMSSGSSSSTNPDQHPLDQTQQLLPPIVWLTDHVGV